MKLQEYIEAVSSKITDTALQSRIREELEDHWEDYCENQSMTDAPEDVLGNETLLTYQTNAVATPGMFGKDILLSVVCGMFTLIVFLVFSSFLNLEFQNISFADQLLTVIAVTIGLIFWSGVAWYIYLALHRHLSIRYGQSIRRTLMLVIAMALPCALMGFDALFSALHAFVADAPFSIAWQLISSLLSLLIPLGIYVLASRLVSRRIADADRILSRLRRGAPLIIAAAVTAGTAILIAASDAPGGNHEALALVGTPFTLPLLILYLFWGLGTNSIGLALHAAGIPSIFAYWIATVFILFFGAILPGVRLVLRQHVSLVLQFAAGVVMPLAIMLPLVSHDVPEVIWKATVVWDWDTLEKKQLNIAYPWAASLMRRDDGMNVEYAASVIDGKITVTQVGGLSYVITPDGVTTMKTSLDIEATMKEEGEAHTEIPAGFSCDGKPLEQFFDSHGETTGPLGMFGIRCEELAYYGAEIATISHGNVIDLDVSEDGLLAVSINMGSYDPTYVYVVSIAGIAIE